MKTKKAGIYAGVILTAIAVILLAGCNRADGTQTQSSKIVHPTDADDFEKKIANGVVLVDFYADWCGPCRQLSPTLNALADEVENATVMKVNVDKHRDLAQKYGVRSIPYLVLFRNGEIQGTKMGVQSQDALKTWLNGEK